jgi:nucleoid DNA-binding protein
MTDLKSPPSTRPPKLNMMLIVADVHDRTEIPKEYVSAVLRGFKELVRDSMIAGVDIDMGPDFGKFVAIEVAGREHFVPATGGMTQTPPRRKIRFRPAPKLRNLPPLRESEEASSDDPDAEVASVDVEIAEVIENSFEEPRPEPAPKLKWMRAREKQAEVVEKIMEPLPASELGSKPKRRRPRKKAEKEPLLAKAASGGPGTIIESTLKDPESETSSKKRRKRTSAVWSPDDIK